jgi:autotransporter-associated beta strand protein
MKRYFNFSSFAASLVLSLLTTASARADVVINEFSAAASDRLLLRDEGGYPQLGMTVPWYAPSYDDSQWDSGPAPFGFGSFAGITLGVNTSAKMQGQVPSLYLRHEFEVLPSDVARIGQLRLTVRYNDGFIAFLNGVEFARRNMGHPGMFAYHDQCAFNPNSGEATEIITFSADSVSLEEGVNTLCFQVHNSALSGTHSTSLLLMADLLGLWRGITIPLVAPSAEWRYFAGGVEPSGGLVDYGLLQEQPFQVAWALPGFDDAAWPETPGPLGFDRSSDYVLGTNLVAAMYGIAASVYGRTRFSATASEAAGALPLELEIDYDDAIIVFLNGVEVARRNIGAANTITPHSELAAGGHNANGDGGGSVTGREEFIQLPAANTLLRTGINVLAVQVHNSSLTSSDLIGRATLRTTGAAARVLAAPEDSCRFFVGVREPVAVEPDDDSDVTTDEPDPETDWIELHNSGGSAVDLSGWSLTDSADSPRKWLFPVGTVIEADGYLVIMADGFESGPPDGASYLHAGFKLDREGEYLALINSNGVAVSEISPAYPEQSPFYSYARTAEGHYAYCRPATPGGFNSGEFYARITQPPIFSHAGGRYAGAVTLQLGAPDAEAQIRYTTDGSEPSAVNGAVYSAPLPVALHTVVRARCIREGEIPSRVITHTFLINEPAGLKSAAAICVSSDPTLALYGPNAAGGPADGEGVFAIKGGTYVDTLWTYNGDTSAFNIPMQRGRAFEKPSSLELFPLAGDALRTDFGLRISGSNHVRPRYQLTTAPELRFPDAWANKPSFNFFFRNELGGSPIDYPLFPGYSMTRFGDVRLRAGKNDVRNPFIKDELVRRIHIDTGQKGSMGIFTALYINGVYKGYYNLCEHLREAFMQQHFGGDKEWDVIQVYEFANGDATRWNAMISFLRQSDMTSTSAYCRVHDYLDVDNFIDYLLVNTYAATWDWPHNNWVAGSERSDEGRWRFFVWDAEGGFMNNRDPAVYDSFGTDLDIGAGALTSTHYIKVIYTRLRSSPEFRLRFADRVLRQAFGEGALTKASMTARFVELRDAINPIMQATNGETVNETFYNTWIASDVRRTAWFSQLAAHGLWPATLAPQFTPEGGEIARGTAVAIVNPNAGGAVYFTTNGVDPRARGGTAAGELYSAPLTLDATVLLKARVRSAGGEWSPLRESYFVVPVDVPVFLPEESADWTDDASWNSYPAPYPDGADVAVRIAGQTQENRSISLRAPVTVGGIQFDMHGSLFRNRVRDRDSGNTLSFQALSGPAAIAVEGIGAGFVEFEVEAGCVLESDLRVTVNNTLGDGEYGAVRLRGNWSGAGGLIKEGPGVLSMTGDTKSYTGSTVVNQGVLQVTEPACPRQSFLVRVNAGGQLRLVSSGTAAEPRQYDFAGELILGSKGRGGDLPTIPGLGVSGGLRYDPDESDAHAAVSARIGVAAASVVHVEGSGNSLTLAGPLYGAAGFVKRGGGTLRLAASAAAYSAPVTVSNGVLDVGSRLGAAVHVAQDGTLTGSGWSGPVQGEGRLQLDGTILRCDAAIGVDYEFSLQRHGAPDYLNPAASGNSLVRLSSIGPGGREATLRIFLDPALLTAGASMRGGIFVEGGEGVLDFLEQVSVAFYVPDAGGSRSFGGGLWSLYTGWPPVAVTAVPETADFGDGPRTGRILEIRVGGPAVTFSDWVQLSFADPAERADPEISGPLACPAGDGVDNLKKYAFDIQAYESAAEQMPAFFLEGGVPVLSFAFDPGKRDIEVFAEAGALPDDCRRMLFDSRTDDLARWDGQRLRIADAASGPAIHSNQFYRLRLRLAE